MLCFHDKHLEKLCVRCGLEPQRPSHAWCKTCHAANMRGWRKSNPLTEEQRFKDNARSLASRGLERGKITRQRCQGCGAERAEMHHPDYSKPLEVEWLCRPCHLEHHRLL